LVTHIVAAKDQAPKGTSSHGSTPLDVLRLIELLRIVR
jgi:hypothetical protein